MNLKQIQIGGVGRDPQADTGTDPRINPTYPKRGLASGICSVSVPVTERGFTRNVSQASA